MMRNAVDIYLSRIDKKKVHLVLQLWYVTFLTVGGNVAVTGAGNEPWSPATFLIVWLVIFLVLERIAGLVTLLVSIWIGERWLAQREEASGDVLLPLEATALYVAQPDEVEAFWGDLAGDEGRVV